jgi:hypothetical protein
LQVVSRHAKDCRGTMGNLQKSRTYRSRASAPHARSKPC